MRIAPSPPPARARPAPGRALLPYLLAARNGFRRGRQYPADHLLKVVGGILFGVVFIAVWRAALGGGGAGTAAALGVRAGWIGRYIAVSQGLLWITVFLPRGLGLPAAVRTGEVTADLLRPVSFFGLQVSREAGALGYAALFRSLPLVAALALLVGWPRPPAPAALAVALGATLAAVWIALCLHYLVGLAAFWTTESRAAHWLLYALAVNLGGADIPLRAYPAALRAVLPWLPFPSLLSTPILAWLGPVPLAALGRSALWAVALAVLCTWGTAAARRRLEVQGG